jgi:hypothetical protein
MTLAMLVLGFGGDVARLLLGIPHARDLYFLARLAFGP